MVKVFFGCAMRGGYSFVSREELARFPDAIEEMGFEVISRHQTQEDWKQKESQLGKKEVHDRDFGWLKEADCGVFEISNPSLGVGAEIADAVHLGKPVLCLYKKGLGDKVSAYIRGKEGSKHVHTAFRASEYSSLEDAKKKIARFVDSTLRQKK